VFNTGMISKLT